MDEKVAYWASIVLAALALVLLIADVSLVNSNRHTQDEITQRQGIINKGMQLSQFNQSLVQAMADASVKDSDSKFRDLLTAQGITIKANGKPASADDSMKPGDKKAKDASKDPLKDQ